MSRSKNKIAVTTLLSALAFSATTTSAAGTNERNIKSVESQTSFSTRKSSESSIKSARSLAAVGGATSWIKKIPTWAKIAIGSTFLTVAMAETYNEIAGAISGKKWYSGKYSFANLGKSIGEKVGQKPGGNNDKNPNISGNDENQNNIEDKTDNDNEIYTNSGNTNLINKKDNTGLGAAISVQEAEIKKRNLQKIDDALDKFALSKNLNQKGPLRQRILEVFMKFPEVKNLDELIKNKKHSNLGEYNVKDFEDLAMLCENKREIQSIEITYESYVKIKIAIGEKKGYYIKVHSGGKVSFEVCDYYVDKENDTLIGDYIKIN